MKKYEKESKALAIIPARGGSKRLPGKNIRLMAGKPLIAYSISSAKRSHMIGEVIVSTDSRQIAAVAKKYGALVPFMRPKRLARDGSPTRDAILYTLEKYERLSGQKIDTIILLQPTSPLRSATDIDNAIKLFREKKADAVISMCEAEHPPEWSKRIDNDLAVRTGLNEGKRILKRRQDYRKSYYPNGAIYVFDKQHFMGNTDIYSGKIYAYIMPKVRSVDIDDQYDFDQAEYLVRKRLK